MEFIKLFVSDTASLIFNFGILIFGIFILVKYVELNLSLNGHLRKYEGEAEKNEGQASANLSGNDVSMGNYVADVSEQFMISYISAFKKYESKCNSLGQIVSLFPMLGILGTVSGLMIQINAQGLEEMTSSIATALTTTFSGILMAIIFKFIDASKISPVVDDIASIIEKYQRRFEYTTTREQLNK